MKKLTLIILFIPFGLFAQNKGLNIIAVASSKDAGMETSYIIKGKTELILVDVPMIKDDVLKLIDSIKKCPQKLTSVYITHAHPDHYLGLGEIKNAFPDVKLMATTRVATEINKNGPSLYQSILKRQGDKAVLSLPQVDSLRTNLVHVNNNILEVMEFDSCEAHINTALYSRSQKFIIGGDLFFNKIHLWLREKNPDSWLSALKRIEKLPLNTIYPGHGQPGSKQLLNDEERYITQFKAELQKGDPVIIKADMMSAYKEYAMPLYLDIALKAYFPKK